MQLSESRIAHIEDAIENKVEKAIDRLDAQLLNHSLTQSEYDQAMDSLGDWAERMFNLIGTELLCSADVPNFR